MRWSLSATVSATTRTRDGSRSRSPSPSFPCSTAPRSLTATSAALTIRSRGICRSWPVAATTRRQSRTCCRWLPASVGTRTTRIPSPTWRRCRARSWSRRGTWRRSTGAILRARSSTTTPAKRTWPAPCSGRRSAITSRPTSSTRSGARSAWRRTPTGCSTSPAAASWAAAASTRRSATTPGSGFSR